MQNLAVYQKIKAESEQEIVKSKPNTSDSLKDLEAIKTMNWHKKSLTNIFQEFNYNKIYAEVDNSYFQKLGVSD